MRMRRRRKRASWMSCEEYFEARLTITSSPSSHHSTFDPGTNPSFCRMGAGIEVRPCDVILDSIRAIADTAFRVALPGSSSWTTRVIQTSSPMPLPPASANRVDASPRAFQLSQCYDPSCKGNGGLDERAIGRQGGGRHPAGPAASANRRWSFLWRKVRGSC